MAAENFAEFLNKLKEMHEKEVQGLQAKLNELTNEKCRDTQRIEELFAKNHQLREQQKVLKDNVKVLENRLRAGLCDRCQVTQELAKKKQHEFEKARFQSLQHIFILTNEMNRMREENKSLKEELRKFCSMEGRPKSPWVLSRDGSSTPDSPLSLLSPRNRKSSPEKTAGLKSDDTCCEPLTHPAGEGQRSSPDIRISPNMVFQGEHVSEMTSQKVANQLHGTIALVRPASRSTSQERDCTGNVSPPPGSKTPPSPHPARSPSLEAYSKASRTDCCEMASSYEMLKLAARKEQLCLLNQPFALRHLSLRKNSERRDSAFSKPLLTAREVGSKTQPHEEWEDQASILDLPAAMVYLKDHLESKLPFLNPQEKLQYMLVHREERKARREVGFSPSKVRSPSPLLAVDKECKKERLCWEDPADRARGKWILINREDLEQTVKAETMREYLTETPLDLSDYGRGRETLKPAKRQLLPMKCEAESPSQELQENPLLQKTSCSSQLPVARHLHESKESEQLILETQEDIPASLIFPLQEHPISKTTSSDIPVDRETKMSLGTEKQDKDQPDDADLDDTDSESMKEDSDEPNTSDSEVTGTGDDESFQGTSVKEKYCSIKVNNQALPKKRKWEQGSWQKACKKSARGKRNGKASLHPDNVQEVTQENDNQGPISSPNNTAGET